MYGLILLAYIFFMAIKGIKDGRIIKAGGNWWSCSEAE